MTREEIMTLDLEGIEARKAEIREEIPTADSAALDAIEAEKEIIEERVAQIRAEIETRKAEMAEVIKGEGKTIEKPVEERKEMSEIEIRNSKEYIDAFASYIKTGKDDECRALLKTTNVSGGQLPVPEFVEGRIKTAWERLGLMDLVRKTYLRGNVKIGFELSATDAAVHVEGTDAPADETLTFGVVSMIPQSIKKWIKISDETVDMGGQEFLEYVYDELTYKIAKKAEDTLIGMITAAPTTASATAVSVAEITGGSADLLGIVANAFAHISDEAVNPVIVMNKMTYAQFKAAQNAAEYAVDPFDGLPVLFNNTLAEIGGTGAWLIVGDFSMGAQANFPNGDNITLKYDDLSLAESDVVKIVGREYVGLGLVADKAFCRVVNA